MEIEIPTKAGKYWIKRPQWHKPKLHILDEKNEWFYAETMTKLAELQNDMEIVSAE